MTSQVWPIGCSWCPCVALTEYCFQMTLVGFNFFAPSRDQKLKTPVMDIPHWHTIGLSLNLEITDRRGPFPFSNSLILLIAPPNCIDQEYIVKYP